MIIDFPGWGDMYAAKASSEFVSVGAVVHYALVIVNTASYDTNDAAVMRSVKESFDPENIVVVLNKADTPSGRAGVKYAVVAYEFSGISLIEMTMQFFHETCGVVLHRHNIIVTAFTESECNDIAHFEYVPKEVAMQKMKSLLRLPDASQQTVALTWRGASHCV